MAKSLISPFQAGEIIPWKLRMPPLPQILSTTKVDPHTRLQIQAYQQSPWGAMKMKIVSLKGSGKVLKKSLEIVIPMKRTAQTGCSIKMKGVPVINLMFSALLITTDNYLAYSPNTFANIPSFLITLAISLHRWRSGIMQSKKCISSAMPGDFERSGATCGNCGISQKKKGLFGLIQGVLKPSSSVAGGPQWNPKFSGSS